MNHSQRGNAQFQFRPAPREHREGRRVLVVAFHGGMPINSKAKPLFYQRDLDLPGVDVLSLADANIHRLSKWPYIAWFFGTEKNPVHLTYERTIGMFVRSQQYARVVFLGSSAGGFPALKFGTMFQGEVLLACPILSPRDYSSFSSVEEDLRRDGDRIVGPDTARGIFAAYGYPKRVWLCYNVLDDHDWGYSRHILPFLRQYEGQPWLQVTKMSRNHTTPLTRHRLRWHPADPTSTSNAIRRLLDSDNGRKIRSETGSGSDPSVPLMWNTYNRKSGVLCHSN